MPIDHASLTDCVEYFDPLTEDQRVKARRIVAGNALNTKDAIDLMMMMGVHPSQDEETVLETLSMPMTKLNRGTRR